MTPTVGSRVMIPDVIVIEPAECSIFCSEQSCPYTHCTVYRVGGATFYTYEDAIAALQLRTQEEQES